jgi:exosortase A-associated hydrolase 2
MNRCRRPASLAARALAQAGFAVLQMDLLGCGDSYGDFADATWDAWLDDVDLARQWLTQRYAGPLWLWGVRGGSLLAAHSAQRVAGHDFRLLFWQPVVTGRQHLQQFLRLRQMAEMVQGGAKLDTAALLEQLRLGAAVEVAGYALSPGLAKGMSEANLDTVTNVQRIVCLEVVTPSPTQTYTASPALATLMQRWAGAGVASRAIGVPGEPFWQLHEAPICTALIEATVAAVAD